MRVHERNLVILRTPKLLWDIVARGRYAFVYDQMPVVLRQMPMVQRLNLLMSGLNLLHRRLTPWSMPLHMQFEPTNFCNLRCPVCPTGIHAVNRRPALMDPAFFEYLMAEVGPYLLTLSLWGWGEPLLHPQLQSILHTARKYNAAVLLSTNGQNLDDEKVIQAIVREPPTYLIAAVDGLTDETHARFRIGAKLTPILNGVRRIAAYKKQTGNVLPVLNMRFIVMQHNEHQLSRLTGFARRVGFDLLTIRTLSIIDAKPAAQTHHDLLPDNQRLRAYAYQNHQRIQRTDFICMQPFWFPTVFADGILVACEQDYNAKLSMGRVTAFNSFRNLWHSPRTGKIRKKIRDTPGSISFCQNCPYRDRPVTDCSVQARFLNADIDYSRLIGHGNKAQKGTGPGGISG